MKITLDKKIKDIPWYDEQGKIVAHTKAQPIYNELEKFQYLFTLKNQGNVNRYDFDKELLENYNLTNLFMENTTGQKQRVKDKTDVELLFLCYEIDELAKENHDLGFSTQSNETKKNTRNSGSTSKKRTQSTSQKKNYKKRK